MTDAGGSVDTVRRYSDRVRRIALLGLLTTVGCDRVFGLTGGGADASAVTDANTITAVFGETGDATYVGVTTDTYLDLEKPDLNFGAAHDLFADGGSTPKLALVRFDVSKLPAAATVVSATLRLTTRTDPSDASVIVARMLEAWDAGTGDQTTGTANWTERMPAVPWSSPGAAPPSRDTFVLGRFTPSAETTAYDVVLDPTAVAGWVADPSTNFGVAIVDDTDDGLTLATSEASIANTRPTLTVVYTP